ncbi:MAG: Zn-ribbon domain-containing OB-fold protein [Dehalococcoidia bacterium]|nr:Zn-ribbon domain-containing OB-fold protein [Dehalococcoidia bacterium]
MSDKKQLLALEGVFHTPDDPSQPPHLVGSRCRACGYTAFPKRAICPSCLGRDTMEETALSRRGLIETFTVSHVAPPGFKAPYLQAYIRLPEGPRIFSVLDAQEGEVDMGSEVELIIDKLAEDEQGNDLIGYKFRPVPGV